MVQRRTYSNTDSHIVDNVATVAAMGWHTLYINNSGELWGMGSNDNGQLGDGTLIES